MRIPGWTQHGVLAAGLTAALLAVLLGLSGCESPTGSDHQGGADPVLSWHIETVDSDYYVGLYPSIVLDGDGHPHISYYDPDREDLKYAHFDGTAWMIQRVGTEGSVGSWTCIALDSADRPHISYFDRTNLCLKYARYGE